MLKSLSYYSEGVEQGSDQFDMIVGVDRETGRMTKGVQVIVVERREATDIGSSYVNYRWWIDSKAGNWRVGRLLDAHAQARWPSKDMTESGPLSGSSSDG